MTRSIERLSLGDLARRRYSMPMYGRHAELQRLRQSLLGTDGALLVYLHGIPGIGKSTLLDEFATEARENGYTVLRLDCRSVEPTERGFLQALAGAIGCDESTAEAVSTRLAGIEGSGLLILDTYELFRLLDPWLRDAFLPELSENWRVLIAGREPPVLEWFATPHWQAGFEGMAMDSLQPKASVEMLVEGGFSEEEAQRANRAVHGHPLALRLLIATRHERTGDLEDLGLPRVLQSLVEMYLAEVPDPVTRDALQAASAVRRITRPLLGAMLPDVFPEEAYGRLEASPFVQVASDGLLLHDAVREAIAAHLKATDPERYRELRRRAWRQLRQEAARVGIEDLWRYTADILYVLENPHVRESFFPTDGPRHTSQRARLEDEAAILNIADRHEPALAAGMIRHWWQRHPEFFTVLRGRTGEVAAFYLAFDPRQADPDLLQSDPVTRSWLSHLSEDPVPPRMKTLFVRRWLTREAGDGPCAAQADCWLDMKRLYMEQRPGLRRVYITSLAGGARSYRDALERLGFVPIGQVEAGDTFYSSINDFGPGSVDGWLARLVGLELGEMDMRLIDMEARELLVNGKRIPLTKLEFALMAYLDERRGRVVSRHSLLADVWGYEGGGSNVIDALIRGIRRKLGNQASIIETVIGAGYRLRAY